MRALLVEPGPNFSVADVARGWTKGLLECGVDLQVLNLGDRIGFFTGAKFKRDGEYVQGVDGEQAVRLAAEGIEAACYRWWPDVLVIVSGFFIPPHMYEVFAARGHRVVLIHTESPYEEDRQLARADRVHVNVLNDPTNLDRYPPGTLYIPHAYDPSIHHPGPVVPDLASDFFFCGTGYPSRRALFERVDWSGVDAAFAGNWQDIDGSPLAPYVVTEPTECMDNREAADWYRSTVCSANLYRKETEHGEQVEAWAMGPREVELAACGTFYARESRPEGDALFPMLPTFTGPDELGDIIRWAIKHPEERERAANAARLAVADRTFAANARHLLEHLDRLPART